MLGILLGTIIGILYFTYKPLFKHLKAQSFSVKGLYQSIKDNAEIRDEFKQFSQSQMQHIKDFINKFSKKDNIQDKEMSNETKSESNKNKEAKE